KIFRLSDVGCPVNGSHTEKAMSGAKIWYSAPASPRAIKVLMASVISVPSRWPQPDKMTAIVFTNVLLKGEGWFEQRKLSSRSAGLGSGSLLAGRCWPLAVGCWPLAVQGRATGGYF